MLTSPLKYTRTKIFANVNWEEINLVNCISKRNTRLHVGRGIPAFMGFAEERVQLLKETEEEKKLRSTGRIGRECCPRKERNF